MRRLAIRTEHASAALFLVMESLAWWIGLRAIASAMTRDAYASMAVRIERVRPLLPPGDDERVAHALQLTRELAANGMAGPPFLAVLGAAVGAFLLVRWTVGQRMPLALAAGLGVAVSLLAFQVLVRLSVVGDLRVWEPVQMLRTGVEAGSEAEVLAFIRDPLGAPAMPGAASTTMGGIAALWLRFLFAGRSPVTYEQVLRSFGVGFATLLLVTGWIAITQRVDVFPLMLAYFVCGIAALAVTQAARARPAASGTIGREPWVISMGVAVGAVALVALVFGALALADGGRLVAPLIDAVVWVAGRLAWAILYPFAVVMNAILELILGGRTLQLDQFNTALLEPLQPPATGEERGPLIPSWLAFLLRTAAILLLGWVLYRIGRIVFATRRRMLGEAAIAEVRSSTTEEVPSGLFRGLFRRRPSGDGISGEWLRRHAVYELFARVVRTARDRGVERAEESTPLEFARDAGQRLGAPVFEPIARAFDEARYGRHYPEGREIEALERSLRDWERSHATGDGEGPSTTPR